MNNDDLIEKLKLMLAEKMLEIEELKREDKYKDELLASNTRCYQYALNKLGDMVKKHRDEIKKIVKDHNKIYEEKRELANQVNALEAFVDRLKEERNEH